MLPGHPVADKSNSAVDAIQRDNALASTAGVMPNLSPLICAGLAAGIIALPRLWAPTPALAATAPGPKAGSALVVSSPAPITAPSPMAGQAITTAGKSRSARPALIRLAQGKPSLVAPAEVKAKAGTTIALPVKVSSASKIGAAAHVIIDGTPSWISLTPGESVGDGVWLLRANQLSSVKMKLSSKAKGRQKMGVLLVDKDGKITGETQFVVALADANAKPAPRTTWQSLIGGGSSAQPAAKAAKKTAKGARPAKKKFKKLTRSQAKAYAKHLVQECTTCHSLYGADDGIPVMVGLKPDRFIDTIDLYRAGKRDNLVMINVARSMDDQQIEVLANYLGAIKPTPGGVTPTAAARGAAAPPRRTARASAGSTTRSAASGGARRSKRLTKRKITQAKLKRAERWVAKGQNLLSTGRIAQARLWFRRAADYGIAEAAMLLGASFDPNYLQANSGYGITANPNQARDWYQYARDLGSQSAAQRLAQLPAG